MALIPSTIKKLTLGPFSVEIRIDEAPLELYKAPEASDDSHNGTRYLEGFPGQVFDIRICHNLKFGKEENDAAHCELLLDGESQLLLNVYEWPGWSESIRDSYIVPSTVPGRIEREKPCFADVSAVGHDESMKESDVSVDFGTIQVTITRGTLLQRPGKTATLSSSGAKVLPIDEKSLKGRAIDQRISLISMGLEGAGLSYKYSDSVFTPCPGGKGQPFHFTFKYRSRKTLQSLGIIASETVETPKRPKSLSPSPVRSTKGSQDSLVNALKLIAAAFGNGGNETGRRAVKRERTDSEDSEVKTRPRKKAKQGSTTIDLT